MYIKSIKLRNWKGYEFADFEFPMPDGRRNVVLIGAKNGFGKTSLLEALILGLFGKEGLPMIPRARIPSSAQGRPDLSYDQFLERALHARARAQGRTSASVSVELNDDDGQLVLIERKWHFTQQGTHRTDQEELLIREGTDQVPLKVPLLEERTEYLRAFIAQHFLPANLLNFFLFDGEQVQDLARREQSAQVRLGIESILGVRVIRELQEDLRVYARRKRNEVPSVGDDKIDLLQAEIREMENRNADARSRLEELKAQQKSLLDQREEFLRRMAVLQSGNFATMKDLYEQRQKYVNDRIRAKDNLAIQLQGNIPLLLVGASLRRGLTQRLQAENLRSQWENGRVQSTQNRRSFTERFESSPIPVQPPLTVEQLEAVRRRIAEAWDTIGNPPPAGSASEFRHGYLSDRERGDVERRLSQLDSVALASLVELLREEADAQRQIDDCDRQVASLSSVEQDLERLAAQLKRCMDEEKGVTAEVEHLNRELQSLEGLLATKKQELGRSLETQRRAQPNLLKAMRAESVADMLERIIQEAMPAQFARVGEEMTRAYKAMAHKKMVQRIDIGPDCHVRLLADGNVDMRSMDASAGEEQIFALSLIAAIAEVSDRNFPVVMDTPLARLDSDHRMGLLRHFTKHTSEQVIFLSQSDEINGPYLEAIRDRVIETYLVETQDMGGGVGLNRVHRGRYFERV